MRYEMISADCHIDLCWLPPDLFVTNAASTEWRDRMPHVVDGPKGPRWTTKKGANLGLACGMGAAGREYVPGRDIANSTELTPLWDPYWKPLWEVVDASGLPLHFHTIGARLPDHLQKLVMIGGDPSRAGADVTPAELRKARSAFATHITGFQINMANVLMALIYGGVLEHHPRVRVVLGEAGIGWIPYVLWRMDGEWEDQFKDLDLTMPPSEYWKRQCWATYQTDPVGIKLLDELGQDKIMWGSDFPHPDGVWPDSREYIQRELGHLPADVRRKIVCDNAAQLYGFKNSR